MTEESTDPGRIRSLAVHRADVLAAFEARERDRKPAVLRVVAPFSGRMRARLHVTDEDPTTEELHLHPETFVDDPPSFPDIDETEDRLREAGEYNVDRHREAYEEAVSAWRECVQACLRERISIPTQVSVEDGVDRGDHEVTVNYLG